ncbi:TPA: pas-pac-pac sensing his kinase, partial [Escherichia coli]|nr:pas-pac-pac sensing his kinase [Escherichia coli]
TILITTTSTPERQFSISVLDDDNKENLPTDTAPCFIIGIPDEYTKAIELLNIK